MTSHVRTDPSANERQARKRRREKAGIEKLDLGDMGALWLPPHLHDRVKKFLLAIAAE